MAPTLTPEIHANTDPVLSGAKSVSYLPGPPPDLTPPDEARALNAQQAWNAVCEANHAAGKIVAGISPDDAAQLMRWIIYQTQTGLLTVALNDYPSLKARVPDSPHYVMTHQRKLAEQILSQPYYLYGLCGDSRSMVAFQADLMGIPRQVPQMAFLSAISTQQHGLAILTLPVESMPGMVEEKRYLVDVAFRQFCSKRPKTYELQKIFTEEKKEMYVPSWGKMLTKTAHGRAVADDLLIHGYTEFTPENAATYMLSQAFLYNRHEKKLDNMSLPPAYVVQLFENAHRKEDEIDEQQTNKYVVKALNLGVDLRDPTLRAMGASPKAMLEKRDAMLAIHNPKALEGRDDSEYDMYAQIKANWVNKLARGPVAHHIPDPTKAMYFTR